MATEIIIKTSLSGNAKTEVNGLKNSLTGLNQSIKVTESGFGTLGKTLLGVFGGNLLTRGFDGITAGLKSVTIGVIQAGDEISTLSQKLGIGTKALQELQFAAKFSDVPVQTLNTSLRIFNKTIGEAQVGAGNSAKIFESIGVSLLDAAGKTKTADVLFGEVSDKIAKLGDQSLKTLVATELFGRSGAELLPLLQKGGTGVDELRKKAQDLGVVLGDDTVNKASQADDAIKIFNASIGGLSKAIGSALIPSFISTTQTLTQLAVAVLPVAKFIGENLTKAITVAATTFAILKAQTVAQSVVTLVATQYYRALSLGLAGVTASTLSAISASKAFQATLIGGAVFAVITLIEKISELIKTLENFKSAGEAFGLAFRLVILDAITGVNNLRVSFFSFLSSIPGAGKAFESLRDSAIRDLGKASSEVLRVQEELNNLEKEPTEVEIKTNAPEVEAEIKAMQDRLKETLTKDKDDKTAESAKKIRETDLQEEQRHQQEMANARLSILQSARDQEIITEEEFILAKQDQAQAALDLEQESIGLQKENNTLTEEAYNNRLTEINAKRVASQQASEAELTKYKQQQAKIQYENTKSSLSQIATLTSQSNKTLFNIGKAAAVANAVVTGAEAVLKATNTPFPLDIILPPLVAASVAAQVATIASAQPPKLAGGIDSVPSGFSDDSFPAFLQSGERVVPRRTNEDLTEFLENREDVGGGLTREDIDAIANRPIIINMDGREIFRVVQENLRSGRVFA